MSDALQTHGLQHVSLPCQSPAPGTSQTNVHQIGDAIQLSYPLLSPSSLAFSLAQHQGHFK